MTRRIILAIASPFLAALWLLVANVAFFGMLAAAALLALIAWGG